MKKSGFLILILISLNKILFPVDTTIRFDHITVEQGLSQNITNCIRQDNKGFMWIGTDDGLNQYDGYTFKTYYQEPNNPCSLSHNRIRSIYEDRHGILWIGTMGGGLNKFIREEEKFIHYRADPHDPGSLSDNTVLSIYEDRSGNFWIGTYDGLNKFDRENETFTHYHPQNPVRNDSQLVLGNWVMAIFEDSRGQLWIGTHDGLNRFDPVKEEFTRYQTAPNEPNHVNKNKITAICEDRSGMLWIGTFAGVNIFDPGKKKFIPGENKRSNPNAVFHDQVESIFKDRSGSLWIGTISGLFNFDPKRDIPGSFQHLPDNHRGLRGIYILSIYEDQSSVMWIGTFSGLYKFDNKKKKFTHYKLPGNNSNNSDGNNNIVSIYEDRSERLWLGIYKGGLTRFNRKNGTSGNYSHNPDDPGSISDNTVFSMLESRSGEFWVGTANGLNKFDFPTKKFYRYMPDPNDPHSLSNGCIGSLCEDSSGVLWIGTQDGLNKFDKKSGSFIVYKSEPGNPNSLSNNVIMAIYEVQPGVSWIATYGGGLNRYDSAAHRFTRYRHDPDDPQSLSNNKIYSIHMDRSGILWIGTNSGGLDRFDKKTGKFVHYTREDGLPNNVIFGILEDKRGNLWLSTNRGISKFNPKTGSFRNYTMDDGLQGYEFLPHAYFKSKRGEMFFGGSNGFNAFYPENVKNNPYVPRVVITSVSKLNKEVKPGHHPLSEIKELKLSHNDFLFSFKFAALEYTAPGRNRYAYKLEGLNDDWIQLNHKHDITFTGLAHGEYVFRVKGSNNDGVWNEEGASIAITIRPPFWLTGWFRLLVIVLLFVILAFLYRIRTDSLRQKLEKERLKRELKLKADFTAMLVHDMRSPLTAVMGYSEMLREYHRKIDISKAGKMIARTCEKMLTLINDMLDISQFEAGKMTMNRKNTALFDIVTDTVEIMFPLLERKAINLVCEQDKAVKEETLFIDPERIGQVIINILSNAVKFTPEKGNIIIKLSRVANNGSHFQELAVTDEGPGIPAGIRKHLFDKYAQLKTTLKGTGLGLAVSRMIVESHGGDIGFRPGIQGKGSTFYFRLPLAGMPDNPGSSA
jgi:ligand-binding sensor domain-containing protein/signal transduction histidine kinase